MAYDKYQHFLLEKKLADELRESTLQERKILYKRVYNDFFSAYPEILHSLDTSDSECLAWQLKFLKHLFDKEKTILEIGAGDCLLSKELAKYFKKVVGYEVADTIPLVEGKPENFELKIFNGFDIPEMPLSYDIVYSNQVFEHLHPDDTIPLLQEYHTFLNENGRLVIVTPHKITGPHDVSRHFCENAEGLHLKEYTYKELKSLLRATGYKNIKGYIGHRKIGYIGMPVSLLIFVEKIYGRFPRILKKKLRHSSVLKSIFGLKIVADKR